MVSAPGYTIIRKCGKQHYDKNFKPEPSQSLHAELFRPTTAIIFKAIKQGFLKMCPCLTDKLVKKHFEKSRNTKMGHLYMRRQGLQSTKENLLIQTCKTISKLGLYWPRHAETRPVLAQLRQFLILDLFKHG